MIQLALKGYMADEKLVAVTESHWLERKTDEWRARVTDPIRAGWNVLRSLGRLNEAQHQFRLAIEDDPGLSRACYNLADVLEEQCDWAGAARWLECALRIDPTFADARFNLARCYEQLSRMTAAARQWSIYLNLDPDGEWADVARQSLRQCGCARRADLVLRRD